MQWILSLCRSMTRMWEVRSVEAEAEEFRIPLEVLGG